MVSKKRTGSKALGEKSPAPSSLKPYRVEMTASAEAAYKEFYRRSQQAIEKKDPSNAHCTIFNMIRNSVRELIPSIAIDKRYALEGRFSNIFRLKKGRMRICWIASSEHRTVIILFISQTLRKEGDSRDPYELFSKMLSSGEYDDMFERLGVKIPTKTLLPFSLRIQ